MKATAHNQKHIQQRPVISVPDVTAEQAVPVQVAACRMVPPQVVKMLLIRSAWVQLSESRR